MTDKDVVLEYVNESWGRNYKSIDDVPYKVLLITYLSLKCEQLGVTIAPQANKPLHLTGLDEPQMTWTVFWGFIGKEGKKGWRCGKCKQTIRITKDGTISKHRIPRAYRNQKMKLDYCPYSGKRAIKQDPPRR